METAYLNQWINKINNSSIIEINSEISIIEKDNSTPFVEKNLKLGYLYYSKDFLGTATNIFKNLSNEINTKRNNFAFIKENEKGLNFLFADLRCTNLGGGNWEIGPDTGCDGCGPICGCIGIAAAMAVCGISADDVCSASGTGSSFETSGCCPEALDSICNCCCGWYK